MTTTDTLVSSYITDGFVVVKNLVAENEIEAVNAVLVDIARGRYPCRGFTPAPPSSTDKEALLHVTTVHHPHYSIASLMDVLRHPGITDVLSKIVGAHLPLGWWDGSVKCMQSMLFCKPPGALGQSWHQDEAFIPTRDRSLCGAWIALDDATADNGCLWALPGAHRPGVIYSTRPHEHPDEWDATEALVDVDTSSAVPLEVKAGSVIFFNGYLPHMSKRNRTGNFRRAFVSHYMSMQSLLPWNLEANELEGWRVGSADQRAVVPIIGDDPHAGRGYRTPDDAMHLRGAENEKLQSLSLKKPA
jgi:phytanoyl-CoA hydroxylase